MPKIMPTHFIPIDRRADNRISAPMTVIIGNTPYDIANWSFGGIKIANYYGPLQLFDQSILKVLVQTAGPGCLFKIKAEVKRYNSLDNSLAMVFRNLDTLPKITLNRYFEEQIAYGQD